MPQASLWLQQRAGFLSAVAVLFLLSGTPSTLAAGNSAALVAQPAPDFSLQDLDHQRLSLAAYRGKVVLLNFWATWCGPCLAEMPQFVAWQRTYDTRGLRMIGISMDDDVDPVRTASRRYGINYPVVMGDEKLGELYGGILGLPVIFLIDRGGVIRFVHGSDASLEQVHEELEKLISEQ